MSRQVRVDPARVLQEDFLGIGVNVIPTAQLGRSLELGYTPAHWELERRRILALRPRVARVWFQPDWMQRSPGANDWELPEFRGFLQYLDTFREAGTAIELNVGWKVGQSIQSWFSIPGLNPYISAPRDIEAFADATADLVAELRQNRGYTNLRYLTFYNEPNGWWDFAAPGTDSDQQAYYARIVTTVGRRLRERGLRDLVELWGPEESGAPEWTAALAELAGDELDQLTFHVYGVGHDDLPAQIAARAGAAGSRPLGLTEFGWGRDETSGWESGFAGTVIAAAAAGLRTCLVWQLNGAILTDSLVNTNGDFTLWDSPLYTPDVKRAYRSAGLLMRTVPAGAVLAAETSDAALRAAGFRGTDGRLVVVVEHSESGAGPIELTVEGATGRRRWHALDYSDAATGNVVPGVARVLAEQDGRLADTLPAGDGFTVYTTVAPAPQVALEPSVSSLQAGETVQLTGALVDAADGLEWQLHGPGRLDADGRYQAPAELAEQVAVAVTARQRGNPAVAAAAVITVRPSDPPLPPPQFSHGTGIYRHEVVLDLSWSPPGATVRFTADLTDPTPDSASWDAPVVLTPGDSIALRAASFTPEGERSRIVQLLIHTLGEPIA